MEKQRWGMFTNVLEKEPDLERRLDAMKKLKQNPIYSSIVTQLGEILDREFTYLRRCGFTIALTAFVGALCLFGFVALNPSIEHFVTLSMGLMLICFLVCVSMAGSMGIGYLVTQRRLKSYFLSDHSYPSHAFAEVVTYIQIVFPTIGQRLSKLCTPVQAPQLS